MKIISTFFFSFLVIIGFSQDFKTSTQAATVCNASYSGTATGGVITKEGLFIHQRDEVEIIDLNTNKIIYNWNPEGGTGQTWLSSDGRFVGNYSQNVKQLESGWSDGMQILDVNTKKVYTKYLKDGYWNKGVFSPSSNEVLVNTYDAVEGGCSILLYDFVAGKEMKTYFSTTKFSTVVMALAFSKDGSKIYAGIAPNASNSYINVYDKKTGDLLKKINLTYQMTKFFIGDDYIFVSGVEGNSGDPHTTKFSINNYSKKAEWDFRIDNIDPTGSYSLMREYKSDNLSKINLESGKLTTVLDVSKMDDFAWVSGISEDGKYYFTNITRVGDYKEQPGTKAFIVFKNELMKDEVVMDIAPKDEDVEEGIVWSAYTYDKPKFSIDFPEEPKKTEGETSKGMYKLSLKVADNDFAYIVNTVEMSKKIKESKYFGISENMGKSFIEKLAPEESKKTEFTSNGQKGVAYTFTKKGVYYRYRTICINGTAYQLIYLNATGDGSIGEQFMDSFKAE